MTHGLKILPKENPSSHGCGDSSDSASRDKVSEPAPLFVFVTSEWIMCTTAVVEVRSGSWLEWAVNDSEVR
jgi:hypothetical protein